MPTHHYDCRVCGEHKELHRILSACKDCREKYGISDFEPTLSEQARALIKIAFILGVIQASAVFLIKWVSKL